MTISAPPVTTASFSLLQVRPSFVGKLPNAQKWPPCSPLPPSSPLSPFPSFLAPLLTPHSPSPISSFPCQTYPQAFCESACVCDNGIERQASQSLPRVEKIHIRMLPRSSPSSKLNTCAYSVRSFSRIGKPNWSLRACLCDQ